MKIVKFVFDLWEEVRFEGTPFPQHRIRAKVFGLTFTLWWWDE